MGIKAPKLTIFEYLCHAIVSPNRCGDKFRTRKKTIMRRTLLLIIYIWCATLGVMAQDAYQQYIDKYKDMAIQQMHLYRIPASITLAQGLLESNAGRSTLATEANNHFGIKVGGTWTGPYVLRDDDARNERFRKYKDAAQSFEDHSLFLSARGRYSSLFNLDPHDYKGWAYGLKQAGYATNPRYAKLLIDLIERYDLSRYDYAKGEQRPGKNIKIPLKNITETGRLALYLCNDIVYVRANAGDTYASVAKSIGIKEKKLRKYNEVDKHKPLDEGDRVYLKKKKNHVAKPLRKTYHTVQQGESMHSISQLYGIRLDYLYKWNRLPADYRLKPGDRLRLK